MNFVFFRLPNIPESGFFFRLRRAKPSLKYCNSPRFIFKNTPKKIGASRLISNSSNLKMTISNSNALIGTEELEHEPPHEVGSELH